MPFPQRLFSHLAWLLGAVVALLFLIQPAGLAQSVSDWTSPRQQQGRWISDRADLIPWQTESSLNRRIALLVGRTRAELAIATLPQLAAGQSAHAFALDLFNAWGVGDRTAHTGVLLFVSPADHRIEIITGKGLGATLPDAEVSRLIQQEILPAFQRQDYAAGLTQAVTAIAQRLEARLPNTVLPGWLPGAFAWLPWIVALGGAGFAIAGSVQAIAFSLARVQVPVPTQGLDSQTFANASDPLAADPFPQLLAKCITPNERPWEQEIPSTALISVWAGGLVLSIGLIQGFWLFVLGHPEAELWQRDATAWAVCAWASSVWLLWGAAVSSRFIRGERVWQIRLQHLLLLGLTALLGGYLWVYQRPVWWQLILVMGCFSIVGGAAWRIVVGDDLQFKRQRHYRCDRTNNPIQALTPAELEAVLTPEETLAQSLGKLEFRGWRDATLTSPLNRDQVYLVQRSAPSAWRCQHCGSFAVDPSTRTVERTVETTRRINRKQKETVTAVIQVKQTVYTCHSCGVVDAYDQPAPSTSYSDDSPYGSSESTSASDSSTSSDYPSSYDTPDTDYGTASGSDFGGGSSAGGGAGSDW